MQQYVKERKSLLHPESIVKDSQKNISWQLPRPFSILFRILGRTLFSLGPWIEQSPRRLAFGSLDHINSEKVATVSACPGKIAIRYKYALVIPQLFVFQ